MRTLVIAAIAMLGVVMPAQAQSESLAPDLLTILTSDQPQTQLMSLILTRASLAEGAQARILLCDRAGDLALREAPEASTQPMQPRGFSPRSMLEGLMADGVQVQVCAIYLPNSEATQDDLLDGVSVATPPEIASVMVAANTRLFTF